MIIIHLVHQGRLTDVYKFKEASLSYSNEKFNLIN